MKQILAGISAMILGLLAIALIFASFAQYRLWTAEKEGQRLEIKRKYEGLAVLAEARSSRLAMVESAKAELESASLIAEAIAIVGAASQEFPEYKKQQLYGSLGMALEAGTIDQIIYIPTEAGMPFPEMGRGVAK